MATFYGTASNYESVYHPPSPETLWSVAHSLSKKGLGLHNYTFYRLDILVSSRCIYLPALLSLAWCATPTPDCLGLNFS